jgi:hypothetical protein
MADQLNEALALLRGSLGPQFPSINVMRDQLETLMSSFKSEVGGNKIGGQLIEVNSYKIGDNPELAVKVGEHQVVVGFMPKEPYVWVGKQQVRIRAGFLEYDFAEEQWVGVADRGQRDRAFGALARLVAFYLPNVSAFSVPAHQRLQAQP